MSESANLQLPYLTSGQAQKHVTVNESLLRLDAIVQLAVVSATTSAEPGSPVDGQVYILPAGKTGTHWGAMTDLALAYYRDGVWEEISPREGWFAFAKDTDRLYFYTGAAWTSTPLTVSASDKSWDACRPAPGRSRKSRSPIRRSSCATTPALARCARHWAQRAWPTPMRSPLRSRSPIREPAQHGRADAHQSGRRRHRRCVYDLSRRRQPGGQ